MNNSSDVEELYCDKSLYEFAKNYASVHGYISIIVCLLGSIANLINITVLSRKEMRSPTNAILTGLAVADLLVMLDYISYACHSYLSSSQRLDRNRFSYGWTTFVLFHSLFSQVCHTISICLTLILAVWRYIAVAYPHLNKQLCGMKRTLYALVIAYLVCPVICMPLYFAVGVHEKHEYIDQRGKRISQIDVDKGVPYNVTRLYYVQFNEWALRDNALRKKINFWIYGVVIKLLPCVILTVLSVRLIIALMEAKKRRRNLGIGSKITLQVRTASSNDASSVIVKSEKSSNKKSPKSIDKEKQTDRTTRMLLAVLLLFLLTEFPQGILGLLSALFGDPFFKQCYIPLGTYSLINF